DSSSSDHEQNEEEYTAPHKPGPDPAVARSKHTSPKYQGSSSDEDIYKRPPNISPHQSHPPKHKQQLPPKPQKPQVTPTESQKKPYPKPQKKPPPGPQAKKLKDPRAAHVSEEVIRKPSPPLKPKKKTPLKPQKPQATKSKDPRAARVSEELVDIQSEVEIDAADQGSGEDHDLMEEHYRKNRRHKAPDPDYLDQVRRGSSTRGVAVEEEDEDEDEEEEVGPSRRGRYSKNARADIEPNATQLNFYPSRWKDFLEDCKTEFRTYAATDDPFPKRAQAINGIIADILKLMVVTWQRDGKRVEKGYWPKYKHEMAILIYNDIASWRGELKKAAVIVVPPAYRRYLCPPSTVVGQAECRDYSKAGADQLIKKARFLRGPVDEDGNVLNFGHQSIRDLLRSFLFGHSNRIGNLRPNEFGKRIPDQTMALAATAIRCVLDGFKANGGAEFPSFTANVYRPLWAKFMKLLKKLSEDEIHADLLESLCCEIAREGHVSGCTNNVDNDLNIDDDSEFEVVLGQWPH
ncbi:hypothetical protein BJ138DRAFT_1200163, partial [Hygrophoropsis aurantiaca]